MSDVSSASSIFDAGVAGTATGDYEKLRKKLGAITCGIVTACLMLTFYVLDLSYQGDGSSVHSGGTYGKGYCFAGSSNGTLNLETIPANEQADCEGWSREQYNMPSHATPGVSEPASGQTCSKLSGKPEMTLANCEDITISGTTYSFPRA